jgi:phosphohistidine phosphatase SixA
MKTESRHRAVQIARRMAAMLTSMWSLPLRTRVALTAITCGGWMLGAAVAAVAAASRMSDPATVDVVSIGSVCGAEQQGEAHQSLVCQRVGAGRFWVARATRDAPQLRSVPEGRAVPADLLARLQRGGYTVFMRHGRTDWNQAPIENPRQRAMFTDTALVSDCDIQRNLAMVGRHEVAQTGASIRRLGVRFQEVVSSPLCRTRETSGLLALAPVRVDNDVFDTFMFAGHPDTQVLAGALRRLLVAELPSGRNRLIVSHALNIVQATGSPMPAEGEMMVFERDAAGGVRHVGSIQLADWAKTP